MPELCHVTTADGLYLDGLFYQPDRCLPGPACALMLIHGTGSNFYGTGLLATIANLALPDGYAVLRINTRGHDLVATIPGVNGPVRGGAAYERVAEAPFDLTAWADWLTERGYQQIVLIGHSLGGVKALWSQVLAPHSAVCGVIGLSPPRFSHHRFQTDPRCAMFRQDYQRAAQLSAAGQGETLLTVTQPLPLVITAAGFLEKYGPADPLDYVPILPRISCPKLILLGGETVDKNPAFAELPESLGMHDPSLSWDLIPGADINFRNAPREPWRRMKVWIEGATECQRARVSEKPSM